MNETEAKKCIYCGKVIEYTIGGKTYKAIKSSQRKFCSRDCYGKYISMTRPNKKKDRLFHVWKGMRERCEYVKHSSARFYQNRGISVCDEWENSFSAFKEWALTNGYDYSKSRKEQSLDRIDNMKGYSPDNCRWVSMKVNNQNTRRNIFIAYNGKTLCLSDWSKELDIPLETIRYRVKRTDDPSIIFRKSKYFKVKENNNDKSIRNKQEGVLHLRQENNI